MKRRTGFWLAGFLAVLMSACGGGGASTPSTPFDVQVILPLTGAAAFLGKGEQQALQTLENVVNKQQGGINGRPVHFVVQDDQSTPTVAVQLANGLVAQKAPIILGPSLVALCNAVAPLVQNGPVLYCLSPGIHPAQGSYAFSSSSSTKDLALGLIDYFRSQGMTRIALLTSTDATGQDGESSVKAALGQPENAGVTLVDAEHFTPTDVSVSAQLIRIQAANPQALIAWSTGSPIATVFKAISQVGLNIPVATTDGNMTYAQMQQYQSFLPAQLLIPSPEWPAYDNLPSGKVKDALKTYYDAMNAAGIKPDISESLAWDPAMIAISALRKLGTGASPEQIRDYIAHLSGFTGINGAYDFGASPQRGLTVKQVVVTRWDGTKQAWVALSTPGG